MPHTLWYKMQEGRKIIHTLYTFHTPCLCSTFQEPVNICNPFPKKVCKKVIKKIPYVEKPEECQRCYQTKEEVNALMPKYFCLLAKFFLYNRWKSVKGFQLGKFVLSIVFFFLQYVESVPRKKCHKEPKKVCATKYEKHCKRVPRKVCRTVQKQKCVKEPKKECKQVFKKTLFKWAL